jgi:hypothetical protein|tara:strand:- start:561 stop:887 length:327 start_codon:yes stop_codon:yes gene_type:complete
MLNRLKEKWDIKSNFQIIVILIVFALTGSASIKFAEPVLYFLNINITTFEDFLLGKVFYYILRIIIVFPIYQILLILIGTLLFQFKFFWQFEKKMLSKIGLKFLFKEK